MAGVQHVPTVVAHVADHWHRLVVPDLHQVVVPDQWHQLVVADRRAEEADRRAEEADRRAEEADRRAAEADRLV